MSTAPPPVAMPTAVMTTTAAATVSRLPKFKAAAPPAANANSAAANANPGSETMGQASSVSNGHSVSANFNSRLNNGFYQHFGQNLGVKNHQIQANGKQNGFMRTPTTFAAKWRKENVEDASVDFEFKPGKTVKKTVSNFTGKTRSLNQNVTTVSSPKAVPKLANSKIAAKTSLNCLAKKPQNGTSSLPRSTSQNSSLPKASSKSSDASKKQVASRSHSSDSIGAAQTVSLTTTDKVRSRSLTQVRRQPSPQNPTVPKSRAYSTNRAERKAPALPTATIKKPLMVAQNGGAAFRTRAGVFKDVGPVRVQNGDAKRNQRRNSVETPSESPGSTPEAPDSRGPSSERGSQTEVSMLGETLEDMSLSSTSSLDRHETSQEYMDDFDNLGDGGVGVLDEDPDSGLDQSRFHDDDERLGVSTATELCFLDDGLDWNHLRIHERDPRLHRLSARRRSSQNDYHSQCGSSLDLSPSDSCGSGGTFLWDEEVEPLGGAVPIQIQTSVQTPVRSNLVQNGFHQIQTKPGLERSHSLLVGSLHSDVSSLDALNDLESCELDEDDLMLDVDFTEDGSLTSDAGSSHMAEWRRRQLCWGTQDVHNENDSDFHADKLSESQEKNDRDSRLSLDLCLNSLKSGPSPGLGVDVEELVEDCSAVRSQLEYLQRLLLQDDDGDEDTLTTDTLSPESTDTSSDGTETQVEVLLQEVLQLREELRSRDWTIAQLTQQLSAAAVVSSRCRCVDSVKTDVQTQTTDRQRETQSCQTNFSETTSGLGPGPFLSPPWQYQRSTPYKTRTKPGLSPHYVNKRVETLVLYFTDQACLSYFSPIRAARTH